MNNKLQRKVHIYQLHKKCTSIQWLCVITMLHIWPPSSPLLYRHCSGVPKKKKKKSWYDCWKLNNIYHLKRCSSGLFLCVQIMTERTVHGRVESTDRARGRRRRRKKNTLWWRELWKYAQLPESHQLKCNRFPWRKCTLNPGDGEKKEAKRHENNRFKCVSNSAHWYGQSNPKCVPCFTATTRYKWRKTGSNNWLVLLQIHTSWHTLQSLQDLATLRSQKWTRNQGDATIIRRACDFSKLPQVSAIMWSSQCIFNQGPLRFMCVEEHEYS